MIITDRMGGFIEARIIKTQNVKSIINRDGKLSIKFKENMDYLILDHIKDAINVQIKSSEQKAGILYNISGSISLKNPSNILFPSFNKYLLIVTNPKKETFLVGSLKYPITFSKHPITSDNAKGQTGEMLVFDGKSPDYPFNSLIL